MYYLGIDISKKSFTVSVLDEEGEAISKVLTFPCTASENIDLDIPSIFVWIVAPV